MMVYAARVEVASEKVVRLPLEMHLALLSIAREGILVLLLAMKAPFASLSRSTLPLALG